MGKSMLLHRLCFNSDIQTICSFEISCFNRDIGYNSHGGQVFHRGSAQSWLSLSPVSATLMLNRFCNLEIIDLTMERLALRE